MPGVFGVDIASYQAGINIQQVVSEGYSFILVKATEGAGYRNPYFAQHVRAARDAGALPGAYHFLRAGSGEAQAISFVNAVNEAMGSTNGVMLVCDNEKDADWATTVAFFHKVWQLTGNHHVIMYTGSWWWKPRGWDASGLTGALWHSRYVDGQGYGSDLYAKVPASWWDTNYGGWPRATILQFSSKGLVAGKVVDVNYCHDMNTLRALAMLGPSAVLEPTDGDDMGVTIDGIDPYDNITSQAAELRNLYFGFMAGFQDDEAEPEGVIARLGRIESAVTGLETTVAELRQVVANISVGGVDVAALATALSGLLPAAPTAAEVAVAVADLEAARMQH